MYIELYICSKICIGSADWLQIGLSGLTVPTSGDTLSCRLQYYLGDEAVSPDSLGEGQAAGHEHAWPVHCMEAQDVFAYDVVARPPILLEVVCRWVHTFRQQTWTT